MKYEHIRTFQKDGFRLDLWDTNTRDSYGKAILRYALFDETLPYGRGIIFEGEDFSPSPLHAIDSDATVTAILNFLSLDKDDTDSEYFDHYTPHQLAWRDSQRREDLAMIVLELEEMEG